MVKNLAIVILNYNSWEETLKEAKLCHELLKVNYRDIIIVDNCSPDDSYYHLKESKKKMPFVLIKSTGNKGYASGNNIGLRYAYSKNYKYAWILNNDIIIEDENIISKLICVFEKDDKIAVVNPVIKSPTGYIFNYDCVRPSFFDFTMGLPLYRKKGRNIKNIDNFAYIYRPQGCCMMVDLHKINEVNYMDEATFLYCEEMILAERLLQKNYLCACCLNTMIIHNHSTVVKSTFAKRQTNKINNDSFGYYLERYRHFNFFEVKICQFFNLIKLILLK